MEDRGCNRIVIHGSLTFSWACYFLFSFLSSVLTLNKVIVVAIN